MKFSQNKNIKTQSLKEGCVYYYNNRICIISHDVFLYRFELSYYIALENQEIVTAN